MYHRSPIATDLSPFDHQTPTTWGRIFRLSVVKDLVSPTNPSVGFSRNSVSEFFTKRSRACVSYVKIVAITVIGYVNKQITLFPCLLQFSSYLERSRYTCPQNVTKRFGIFWKSAQYKPYFTPGERIYIRTSHIYCPIWVKFCTRYLHIILLDLLWVSWKWAQGRPTFICG